VAQRVVTALVDDVTGEEIPLGEGETIRFAVNGTQYEIDLDTRNAEKFHKALAFYIDHGRKVGRTGTVTALRRSRKNDEVDPAAVRAWAESNGIEVNARGRLRSEVVEQYRAAMA
jgi:hypothetical protein